MDHNEIGMDHDEIGMCHYEIGRAVLIATAQMLPQTLYFILWPNNLYF